MRELMPRRGDDRGVIGVLVAAMLGCGVLLGMGMLVIDVGQIYQNGAELQNGADAGALAIAGSCALGGTCALADVFSLASRYASANASGLTDHQAAVDLVCGTGSLGGCPASAGGSAGPAGPVSCPPAPPAGTSYVDVRTGTRTGSGSAVLPPLIGGLLSGYQGTSVGACAQAEWGSPARATGMAVTVSACSWYSYTIAGTRYAPPPPYPPNLPPTAPSDHAFVQHGGPGTHTTGCPPFQPSGQDGPGTFGWTTSQGGCSAFVGASYPGPATSGGNMDGGTARTTPADCAAALHQARASRSVVYLPVYASISPAGSTVSYSLLGFAAFVVTGYHLAGGYTEIDWLNPANTCTGDRYCIDGYFTRGLIPETGDLGGNDLGASIVKLSG